jgi:1,2-diacylglycerol 3-beta-glucosyltransferase
MAEPEVGFVAKPARFERRGPSALFLLGCSWAGMAPHWLDPSLQLWPALSLAVLLGGYSLRTVLLQALRRSPQAPGFAAAVDPAVVDAAPADLPAVDVVVAARDEQAVITRLVEGIARLRYPQGRLCLWVVDDASSDRTPQLLAELQQRFPFLKVLRREPGAGGGKSGALNLVSRQLQGRWMLVLDADADLQPDTLERLIPMAEAGGWSAVQLRKAVVNPLTNWLTRAQAMEMALDAVIQQGRLGSGGVAELRGNGQLLKREGLQRAGGFNEDTVTDDLDLSFRLLLAGEPVGILWDPPVREEAVLTLAALWRQRQRWAEGGLQRFFDYWPQLCSDRLSRRQRLDLACFFLLQYAMPVVALADLLGALLTASPPTFWPLSFVAFALSGGAILTGCRRPSEGPSFPAMTPWNLALGIAYLGHWFVVIPWTTLRMALLPKTLVWAKTAHLGAEPAESIEPVGDGLIDDESVEDPATA